MKQQYSNSPMYALCLLAAVCVRQHVQSGAVQSLTKGVSMQRPMSMLTKPSKYSLTTTTDKKEDTLTEKSKSPKYLNLEEANALVLCVQQSAKRAQRIINRIETKIPPSKTCGAGDAFTSYKVTDWMSYLVSNIGTKWLA